MLTGTALTPGSCAGERRNELALEVAGKHHNCVVTAQILGGAFLNIANTHSVSNLLGLLLGTALIVDGAALRRVTGPVAGLTNGVALKLSGGTGCAARRGRRVIHGHGP